MSKRFLLLLAILLLPIGAAADDATAGLGPQTVAGSGGSNADAATLQPAGTAPIQSTTSDSTGLTAPSSALQAPVASSTDLQVLSGEADGAPHAVADSAATPWMQLIFTLILVVLAAGVAILVRDRRRFARTGPIRP